MSFQTVFEAVYDQISNDSVLTQYIEPSDFIKGFKEVLPARKYMMIFEPGQEVEVRKVKGYKDIIEVQYDVQIFCRLLLAQNLVSSAILGNSEYRGLLGFVEDAKAAIRKDMSFSYNTYGRSLSEENAADSFDLDSSHRYLTVSIDGKTPTGYDAISCGVTTLTGAEVATNIQASLRLLGRYDDDGYKLATCTFNATTNQFTINSSRIGPTAMVTVTAGASNDASEVLGFDTPMEYRGTNIIQTQMEIVTVENSAFPVRFRVIPLLITEETFIGG